MANTGQSNIIDYCASRLVDVRNIVLDTCLALLLHILSLSLCRKTSSVHKTAKFHEAEGASKEGKLSFEKVQRSTIDFNEQ